jgi:ATP/maltotriose-dependent transcriptional regulator MalT
VNLPSELPPEPEPDPAARRLLAVRAAPELAAGDEAARCAAVLGWPLHEWQAARDRLGLPAAANAAGASALADWFARAPGPAAQALARALSLHLQHDRVEAAAPLALAFGTAAQRLGLLRQAGWQLLWRPQRRVLGPLLDSVAMEPGVDDVLPLQMAWWIEVERVPHAAERRLQQGTGLEPPVQALLRGRIAQVFDDARGAVRFADEAMAGFANDLQPLALWARYALGFALLDAGRPRDALAPLAALVRACGRDDLPMLALDAMSVQARAHDELADEGALRATLSAARQLARDRGVADAPSLQALERQRLQQHLRAAAFFPAGATAVVPTGVAGADLQADEPLAPPLPAAHYDAFPGLVIEAMAAMQVDAHERAVACLAELDRRLAFAFHCHKWRNGQRMVRLWWLARRPDAELLAPAREMEAPPDAQSTLVEWHAAVLAAAAGVLAGAPLPREQLQGWDELLARRGLPRLRGRLLLLRALGPPADAELLLRWLQAVPAQAVLLDAQWLAPKLAAVLEALLALPQLVRHPAERALAQRLLQQMLASPAVPSASTAAEGGAGGPSSAPPADLTLREWEILQLIGQHYTNEQIATRLNVSVATVKTHINRVYGKLGIGSRAEAVQRVHHLAPPR